MPKTRLDLLLVERGLAESRAKAQVLIMAGRVRLNDQVALKPAVPAPPDAALTVDPGPRFVSRGGDKLEGALTAFALEVDGLICADVGASTGGFTDCLLQHGAAKVYAIDVGRGILHWKLRNDPRVVVMEGVNARYLESLPEAVSLGTADASFISLKALLPAINKWMAPDGNLVCLIKPQFEAGRRHAARGEGVIRDPQIHKQVLQDVLEFAVSAGYGVRGLMRSPLVGPKGNAEFLAWLDASPAAGRTVPDLVARVMQESLP